MLTDGANCVRVVLADGSQWGKTSRQEVENIIAWCEERGLICILEVHDHTGFDEASRLQNAVNYWIALRDLVNAHKDYVIVNIAMNGLVHGECPLIGQALMNPLSKLCETKVFRMF